MTAKEDGRTEEIEANDQYLVFDKELKMVGQWSRTLRGHLRGAS